MELLISYGTSKGGSAGHIALAIRDQERGDDLVYTANFYADRAPKHVKGFYTDDLMREKEANTDVNTQIAEVVGSGPFLFVKEEWVPGAKAVYRKNPSYVPRPDPPDGFAGAKIAKVDRVEWLYLPDPNTATQALIRGEGDVMEIPPTDLIPILQKDSSVVLQVIDKTGTQAIIRPNHLFPPFDNAKARQALLYLVGDQKDTLAVMVGRPDLEIPCWAV